MTLKGQGAEEAKGDNPTEPETKAEEAKNLKIRRRLPVLTFLHPVKFIPPEGRMLLGSV